MSRRGKAEGPGGAEGLKDAVAGLMGALDEGRDHLPPERVAAAEKVLHKASERLEIAGHHTVVALAGATGSGKSSLFNRIVGSGVATVGMLRPTTTTITSAVWGEDPATELLDWVGSASRHRVSAARAERAGEADLDGLVLLDLPDVDSHRTAHRAEADRVLALTDVFLWVTDPQKYADAILHEDYLSHAKAHRAVTLVVLNQADRLSERDAEACRDHLQRLLADDGLPNAHVLLVSAKTGQGLDELRRALSDAARAATAARARLLGDVVSESASLRCHVADTEPELPAAPRGDLVDALARSAGVPVVLHSVEQDYRRRAGARTGWPLTRWARGLRPDPLKKLRLDTAALPGKKRKPGDAELETILSRSSLPEATPAARAAVATLTRRLGTGARLGLPPRWGEAVERAVGGQGDLADSLDQAIVGTPLRDRNPMWWGLFGLLQWLFALTAFVGLAWLLLWWAGAALQFALPDLPFVGIVPLPTALLFGGLLAGLLLAVLARPLAAAGARRRRRRIEKRLRHAITEVAKNRLLAPTREVLDRHRRTREHLDAVARANP